MSDFMATPIGQGILIVVYILCIVVPLLLCVAYLTYAERKVIAKVQLRKGPNVVGPFGLLQPIADGIKLVAKETIIPTGANRVVFLIAPMITFVLALVAWAVIPFGARPCCPTSMWASSISSPSRRSASTASSWPAGPAIRSIRSSAACAPRRRWCPTKSPSAS